MTIITMADIGNDLKTARLYTLVVYRCHPLELSDCVKLNARSQAFEIDPFLNSYLDIFCIKKTASNDTKSQIKSNRNQRTDA